MMHSLIKDRIFHNDTILRSHYLNERLFLKLILKLLVYFWTVETGDVYKIRIERVTKSREALF